MAYKDNDQRGDRHDASRSASSSSSSASSTRDQLDPTVEESYWREHYASRPYASQAVPYEMWAPAYRYGWESRSRYAGKSYEDVQSELESGWEQAKSKSSLAWKDATSAVRDAWNRAENYLLGDEYHDGR